MATVILMNLMIAILSNVYQEVQSDVQSEFLARRVMFIASTIRVGCFQLKMWEKFVRNYILPEDKGLPGILSAPKRGVTNGLKYEEIDSFHWIFFFFFFFFWLISLKKNTTASLILLGFMLPSTLQGRLSMTPSARILKFRLSNN